MHPTTCQTWILPSSCWLWFLHLIIHVKYVRKQTLLIRCYFERVVMVDTIYSTSSWSSFKFPPAFGSVHHVLLQHLDFYSDHATLSRFKSGEGIHENFISTSFCGICACISFWLISFYLWLVLFFLFSRVYYGFIPLPHRTSQHYTSWQLSCSYAWPHTWQAIMGMPIMPLGLMYVIKVNVRS